MIIIAYLLFAAAVALAWKLALGSRTDAWGAIVMGVLWPATVFVAAVLAAGSFFSCWVTGIAAAFASPEVCEHCGLFRSRVTMAGDSLPQCQCNKWSNPETQVRL